MTADTKPRTATRAELIALLDYPLEAYCQGHETTAGPVGVEAFCDGTCLTNAQIIDLLWEEVP